MIGPGHDQRVIAEVPVELLVVVNRARVLGPEFSLREPHPPRVDVQCPRRGVDHVGVEGEPVRVPVSKRELQQRELGGPVDRPPSGVREVGFGCRVIRADRSLRCSKRCVVQETRDDHVALLVVLLEMCLADLHVFRPGLRNPYGTLATASNWLGATCVD